MANREQRRRAQKTSPISGFLEKALKGSDPEKDELENVLNTLPMPSKQEILPSEIRWTWKIGLHGTVQAFYFGATNEFHVELNTAGMLCLKPDESLALGQALVSAWNWENVWQQHVGHFVQKEMTEKTQVVTDSRPETQLLDKDLQPIKCCCHRSSKQDEEDICPECYKGNHDKCVGPLCDD